MTRGVGEFAIQAAIPDWMAPVVAVLTQFGDVWFLAVLVATLYAVRPAERAEITALGGVWFAAVGLVGGLKEVLALPRPGRPLADPELFPSVVGSLYEVTASAGGYGFPSGHATGATVVYLGLAAVLPVATRRIRFAGAAGLVVLVSLTRVALGVHYLVDVVAGVALGLGLLFATGALAKRRPIDPPTLGFALAIVAATFFVGASGASRDALLLLGVSLGGLAGWRFVGLGRATRGG